MPVAKVIPFPPRHRCVSASSPTPFVSEYLTRPLRTEAEARAQLNRPRIPRAKSLLECIAEQTGIDRAFAKLIGGGQ